MTTTIPSVFICDLNLFILPHQIHFVNTFFDFREKYRESCVIFGSSPTLRVQFSREGVPLPTNINYFDPCKATASIIILLIVFHDLAADRVYLIFVLDAVRVKFQLINRNSAFKIGFTVHKYSAFKSDSRVCGSNLLGFLNGDIIGCAEKSPRIIVLADGDQLSFKAELLHLALGCRTDIVDKGLVGNEADSISARFVYDILSFSGSYGMLPYDQKARLFTPTNNAYPYDLHGSPLSVKLTTDNTLQDPLWRFLCSLYANACPFHTLS